MIGTLAMTVAGDRSGLQHEVEVVYFVRVDVLKDDVCLAVNRLLPSLLHSGREVLAVVGPKLVRDLYSVEAGLAGLVGVGVDTDEQDLLSD